MVKGRAGDAGRSESSLFGSALPGSQPGSQPASKPAASIFSRPSSGRGPGPLPRTASGVRAPGGCLPGDDGPRDVDVGWRAPRGAPQELAGRNPDDVLAELLTRDRLGLRRLVEARLRAGAYFVDPNAVLRGLMARVALRAGATESQGNEPRGPEPIDTDAAVFSTRWFVAEADAAIESAVMRLGVAAERAGEDDRPADRHGRANDLGSFLRLAEGADLQHRALLGGIHAIHARPRSERVAFRRVLIEGQSLESLARERGESLTALARCVRRALLAFLDGLESASAVDASRDASSVVSQAKGGPA